MAPSTAPIAQEIAGARMTLVLLLQLLALAVCYWPLVGRQGRKPWQQDCHSCGIAACFLAITIIAVVLGFAVARPPGYAEYVVPALEYTIALIYFWNIATLAAVTMRTGGTARSLYAPLIPIQLSAILFLLLQRDNLAGMSSPLLAGAYVASAIAALLVAARPRQGVIRLLRFRPDPAPVDWFFETGHYGVALTAAGMLLSFVIYLIPIDGSWLVGLYHP